MNLNVKAWLLWIGSFNWNLVAGLLNLGRKSGSLSLSHTHNYANTHTKVFSFCILKQLSDIPSALIKFPDKVLIIYKFSDEFFIQWWTFVIELDQEMKVNLCSSVCMSGCLCINIAEILWFLIKLSMAIYLCHLFMLNFRKLAQEVQKSHPSHLTSNWHTYS